MTSFRFYQACISIAYTGRRVTESSIYSVILFKRLLCTYVTSLSYPQCLKQDLTVNGMGKPLSQWYIIT